MRTPPFLKFVNPVEVMRRLRNLCCLFLPLLLPVVSGCGSGGDSAVNSRTPGSSRKGPSVEQAYHRALGAFRRGRADSAQRILSGVTRQDDAPPEIYILDGKLHYNLNQFQEAVEAWTRALEFSLDSNLRRGLQTRLKRARALVDVQFRIHSYTRFQILLHPGIPGTEAGTINHRMMAVYNNIGGDMHYYPDYQFTVMVHTPDSLRDVMDAPRWSVGLFDGKIHLQYNDSADQAYSYKTLYHEYTHALISLLADQSCPLWLNEGLATFQEHRQTASQFHYRVMPDHPPDREIRSLSAIKGLFDRSRRARRVRLAYEYSYSLIDFLQERHGMHQLRRVLQVTGDTASFDRALKRVLSTDRATLFREWSRWARSQIQ